MWKRFMRLMAPEGEAGAGEGGGAPAGEGAPAGGTPPAEGQAPAGQAAAGKPGGSILSSAGNGDTPPPEGQPPAGTPPAGDWFYADGTPGVGERPAWLKDKYKTVAAQAQALPELETRLGRAAEVLGAPEADYTLPELPDWQWDAADPMLVEWRATAKELGLSQKAFDQVAGRMAKMMGAQQQQEMVALSDALASLGANVPQRLEHVERYLRQTVGAEGFAALDSAVATDVNAYLALEQLVTKLSGDAQLSTLTGRSGPSMTKADIEAEQYKTYPEGHKLAGQRMYDHDKAHRAKVDGMWKALYPGEDRTEVG